MFLRGGSFSNLVIVSSFKGRTTDFDSVDGSSILSETAKIILGKEQGYE